MERPRVHYPAVLVSAVAMFLIGWAWYYAFVGVWMEGAGVTQDRMMNMSGAEMGMAYVGSIVAYLLMFYVMAHFIAYAKAMNARDGAMTGFWSWLGFVAPATFVLYSYQLKPVSLFLVDSGYWLVSMLVGGVILAVWKKKDAAV